MAVVAVAVGPASNVVTALEIFEADAARLPGDDDGPVVLPGPSGSTKADAEAKRLMKEAVYMVAFRCLVLLTQVERALLVLVRRSTGLMRPENVFFSHRYELCAAFWAR